MPECDKNCLRRLSSLQRTALEERRMQLRTVRQQVARMREKMAVRSAKMKELQNSNADRRGLKFLFPSVEANNVTDALLNI